MDRKIWVYAMVFCFFLGIVAGSFFLSKKNNADSSTEAVETYNENNKSAMVDNVMKDVPINNEPVPEGAENSEGASNYFGKLHVDNTKLCDASGKQVQLLGVSSHGLNYFPEFVTADSIKSLHDSWGINIFRLAMYTEEANGYCVGNENNRKFLLSKIDESVNAATMNNMYVIIDWHILSDSNPLIHKSEAIDFFDTVAKKYANNEHVLYEICNEPNSTTTWDEIYYYANEVIPVIRKYSSDAIILVGTPCWCQDIEVVAQKPLEFENVMYTFHFYSSTHKQGFRDKVTNALDANIPVFISEFGLCEAAGNGEINYEEAQAWLQFIDEKNLSACIWNLSNKNESSALIKDSCNKKSNWEYEDLSTEGQIIYEYFKNR